MAFVNTFRGTACFGCISEIFGLVVEIMDRARITLCVIVCVCYWGVLGPFLAKFPDLNSYARTTVVFLGVLGILGLAVLIAMSVATFLLHYDYFTTSGESLSTFLSGKKTPKTLSLAKYTSLLSSSSELFKSDVYLWNSVTTNMRLTSSKDGDNLFHYPDLLHFLLVVTPDPHMRLTQLQMRGIRFYSDCNSRQTQRQQRSPIQNSESCELCAKSNSSLRDFSLCFRDNQICQTIEVRSLKELSKSAARRHINVNILTGVHELPLPTRLKDYVVFEHTLEDLYTETVGAFMNKVRKTKMSSNVVIDVESNVGVSGLQKMPLMEQSV